MSVTFGMILIFIVGVSIGKEIGVYIGASKIQKTWNMMIENFKKIMEGQK